jgi:cell division initiation protein
MKITPLEIRQKSFEREFRGYDKDEVSAFLQILSAEWEKIMDENKELNIKLEAAEKEITKLREVENSLYKTLKTAEDTGANMIQQANKAAELQLKETKMQSEGIVREAKSRAKQILDVTEKNARDIINKMLNEIKSMERNFQTAVSIKETLLADLTNLSTLTLERVEKLKKQKDKLDIEKHMKEAREFAQNFDLKNFKTKNEDLDRKKPKSEQSARAAETPPKKDSSQNTDDSGKSFFDMLE